jgi:tol-pal system protein YbgF
VKQTSAVKWLRAAFIAGPMLMSTGAHAALFSDDEARTAILELRKRLDAGEVVERRLAEENNQLRRSLLDLQNQIESLRAEQARMRGQGEQLTRDLAETQRRQAAMGQALEDRLRVMEPQKVNVDGKEFVAAVSEKRDFDAALAVFRAGDFAGAQAAFLDFAKRYPKSGYNASVLFWLGNAQYATRDYKEAITNFRSMLAQAPEHPRAAEALLSIANCQIELKDTRAARRTLEDVVRLHPQSEAAQAAKERLVRLR